jgi:hypothetical protein
MNFYSIEFFKDNLKEISAHVKRMHKLNMVDAENLAIISSRLDAMVDYVKDREEHNKSAYSKKHMRKLK